jgi:hypothetical protein
LAGETDDSGLAWIVPPVLHLLVDIDRGVPAGQHEHRDEQARGQAALSADSAEVEPVPGDREAAVVMAEREHQTPD